MRNFNAVKIDVAAEGGTISHPSPKFDRQSGDRTKKIEAYIFYLRKKSLLCTLD